MVKPIECDGCVVSSDLDLEHLHYTAHWLEVTVFRHRGHNREVKNDGRAGFTLIELLTVVAILSSLAAILAPGFSNMLSQSTQSTIKKNVQVVQIGMRLSTVLIQIVSCGENNARASAAPTAKARATLCLLNRLKLYSNRDGEVCDSRREGLYPLGPYLDRDFPMNPAAGSAAVLVYPIKAKDAAKMKVYS